MSQRSRHLRARRNLDRRFTMLGLLAIAVVAVVGYIGFTANSGLPLQGRKQYSVAVPDADRLIPSADVRIGGIRVGQVLNVDAVSTPGTPPYARVKIALDSSVGRVPSDSTAQVRPASVLGLTYIDLHLGRATGAVPENATLPLARARPSSDLTDLFDIFDRSAAARFRKGLTDLSGGLAGRGTAINSTLASVSRLLPELTAVANVLAAPRTHLPQFLRGYEATVSALANVSPELAGLIAHGATTFAALAAERPALGAAIDAAPRAEADTTRAFTAVRPGLDALGRLAIALRPAARELPRSLTAMNATLAAGVRPLTALPSLAPPLNTALSRLDGLDRDPNTNGALRKVNELAIAGQGALRLLVPAQVNCDVVSLFMQGFAGTFGTLGTGDGPALGALFLAENGATGESLQNAKPSPNLGANPLPNENADECESGNEPWSGKQQLGSPAGLQNKDVRPTAPPPGVLERAASAGLMTDPVGVAR